MPNLPNCFAASCFAAGLFRASASHDTGLALALSVRYSVQIIQVPEYRLEVLIHTSFMHEETHVAVTATDPIKIIFAILLPPVGVFMEVGFKGHFWLNILLTLLGYGMSAFIKPLFPLATSVAGVAGSLSSSNVAV